jgi:hypothetical protein
MFKERIGRIGQYDIKTDSFNPPGVYAYVNGKRYDALTWAELSIVAKHGAERQEYETHSNLSSSKVRSSNVESCAKE